LWLYRYNVTNSVLNSLLQGHMLQLDELGRLLTNVCNIVPGGLIAFFPSYEYEKFVYTHWENSGVLARLGTKKKVGYNWSNVFYVGMVFVFLVLLSTKC